MGNSSSAPIFLTLGEILEIHQDQISRYGGSDGILSRGALESAVAQPEATFGGQFLYADIFEIAADYLFHLADS